MHWGRVKQLIQNQWQNLSHEIERWGEPMNVKFVLRWQYLLILHRDTFHNYIELNSYETNWYHFALQRDNFIFLRCSEISEYWGTCCNGSLRRLRQMLAFLRKRCWSFVLCGHKDWIGRTNETGRVMHFDMRLKISILLWLYSQKTFWGEKCWTLLNCRRYVNAVSKTHFRDGCRVKIYPLAFSFPWNFSFSLFRFNCFFRSDSDNINCVWRLILHCKPRLQFWPVKEWRSRFEHTQCKSSRRKSSNIPLYCY